MLMNHPLMRQLARIIQDEVKLTTECFLGAGFVNPAGGLYASTFARHPE
jgi:hypothetical protein